MRRNNGSAEAARVATRKVPLLSYLCPYLLPSTAKIRLQLNMYRSRFLVSLGVCACSSIPDQCIRRAAHLGLIASTIVLGRDRREHFLILETCREALEAFQDGTPPEVSQEMACCDLCDWAMEGLNLATTYLQCTNACDLHEIACLRQLLSLWARPAVRDLMVTLQGQDKR